MKDDLKKLGLRVRHRKVDGDAKGDVTPSISDLIDEGSEIDEHLRRKGLVHPGLSIADDAPSPNAPMRLNPKGSRIGYNPYESGMLTRKPVAPKRDLQKLSDWIEAKKRLSKRPPDKE